MFGECHAHMLMDGVNYQAAVERHRGGVSDRDIRAHLKAYRDVGVSYVRDGGDGLLVSKRAKELAPEYGIDYRTPVFAIHKNGHYGGIVGLGFDTMREYHALVKSAAAQGADFIKIMTTGILDFRCYGRITGEPLDQEEVKEMVHIAHGEGFAVMSHTNGVPGVRAALEAGVDSLEHGNYMDEETIQMLSESSTVWVPTLVTIRNLLGCGRYQDRELLKIQRAAERSLRLAYQKGASLALGSDGGAYMVPHGWGILEEYRAVFSILGEEPQINRCLEEGESQIRRRFQRS
ncbi:MAG: Xaa-Pro dipeptidase [Eubacteriales bacterium]|nr:Xaa-Pro dipeptidase [Eubacteriales bacterium]